MRSRKFEQALAALVFSCRLERRDKIKIRFAVAGVILLFCVIVFEKVTLGIRDQADAAETVLPAFSAVGGIFYSMGIIAVMAGMIVYTRRVSLMEAIYAETCAYLTEHIAYCVRILCDSAFGSPVADDFTDILYWVIHVAVYLAAYYWFARKMIHRGHYYATPKRTIALLVYVLAIILILSLFASIFRFEVLHAVYAMAFAVYALVSQIDRQKQLAEQEEGTIRQQLMVAQKEQYDLYRQNVSTVDRKCHDLRHQAGHLLNSASNDEQREEIKSLMRDIMIYDSFVHTGNRDLDTILNQKNAVCARKHIELTCVADGRSLGFMEPADLFAVFDRLIDRAVAQTEGLPEEMRRIHLTASEKLGLVIVMAEYPRLSGGTGRGDVGAGKSGAAPGKNGASAGTSSPVAGMSSAAMRKSGAAPEESSAEREQFLRAMEMAVERYDGSVQISEGENAAVRIVLQAPDEFL